MKTWLMFDVSYLAWRNYHALKRTLTTAEGVRTEVLFGILRDIDTFSTLHNSSNLVFCFDFGVSLRKNLFDGYKEDRNERTAKLSEEERLKHVGVKHQIDRLRKELLAYIGYKNILFDRGYEGDDMIAKACQSIDPEDTAIIISADTDLLQLLSRNVIFWSPKTRKATNVKSFKREFGIKPKQWRKLKAIIGGHDNIPGIPGVGIKTALKYMRKELPHTSSYYTKIQDFLATDTFETNMTLCKLPFKGTMIPELVEDDVDDRRWNKVMQELEIKTLTRK